MFICFSAHLQCHAQTLEEIFPYSDASVYMFAYKHEAEAACRKEIQKHWGPGVQCGPSAMHPPGTNLISFPRVTVFDGAWHDPAPPGAPPVATNRTPCSQMPAIKNRVEGIEYYAQSFCEDLIFGYTMVCKFGVSLDGSCIPPDEAAGDPICPKGNPIDVVTNNKFQKETDYESNKANQRVVFQRFYNSLTGRWTYRNQLIKGGNALVPELKPYASCKFNYSGYDCTPVEAKRSPERINSNIVELTKRNGEVLRFKKIDEVYQLINATRNKNKLNLQFNESLSQWSLISENVDETYNIQGELIRELVDGRTVNYSYSPNKIMVSDGAGELYSLMVDDEYNLINLSVNGNILVEYKYDELKRLVKVVDGNATKTYHYENNTYKYALTGISDRLGKRYATWVYDAEGRTISSEHAGGADKTSFAFNADGSTTVTNALNKQTIYHFANIAGAKKIIKVEGQPTESCAGANQIYTYTSEGWIESKTDWKGVKTTFIYNTLGQETSRTEAFGTPEARTITTEWHPTFFVETKVTEPEKETVYSYDSNGRLLKRSTRSISNQ